MMNLTLKQQKWLFKGEFIELFEEFEEKRKNYNSLTSKLSCTKIGYHIPRFETNSLGCKTIETNTYPIINDLLHQINKICSEIEPLEIKIEEMRKRYKTIFKEDLNYRELVLKMTEQKK